MKGLKKFKESLPECNRDGIVKIFDSAIYYIERYEAAQKFAKERGERRTLEVNLLQPSVYAYESCIRDLGLLDKFREYRELKALNTPAQ